MPELVFKGGTCLAKVHVGFYRMSEDLDFAISTPVDAKRADRSRSAANSKKAVAAIGKQLPGLHVITALTGANESSQYAAVIGYTSLLGSREEVITIEVGLREPVLTARGKRCGAYLLPAARADLLRRLGRWDDAADAYRRAIALVANHAEQRFFTRHLHEAEERARAKH